MNFSYTEQELDYLARRDKKIAVAIKLFGKIERTIEPDIFTALTAHIVGQQISNKAFETVWGRFKDYFKEITPKKIISESEENIQKLGISLKKANYIKNIAQKITNKELNTENLKNLSDEEAISELTKLNGIGVWTAEMLLLFSMERKNVFSYGDFAIRKGLANLHNYKEVTKPIFEKYRKLYSPYASIASIYLWEIGNMDLKINLLAPYVYKEDFLTSYDSPLGKILLVTDGESLTGLFFTPISKTEKNLKIFSDAKKYLDAYFNNKKLPTLPKIKFRGTPFQTKIWQELLKIPYGETVTYGELSKVLNSSPRAIGNAVGKNPISIIVPCHRVIGSNNKLTGYAWGMDIKEKLLKIESIKGI